MENKDKSKQKNYGKIKDMEKEHILSVRGVKKTYSNGQRALDGVDVGVGGGRIVGLLGQNGAGKSTLVRCVLGLLEYEGEIEVLGRESRECREELMRDVAFISDVALLPSWMSVEGLMRLTDELHPNFKIEKAMALLKDEDVPLDRPFSMLSKGNKTIVHLVMVLGIDARLYVLDEPFLGLDINRRRRFLQRILERVEGTEKSVVVATHQIEEIEPIVTDLILIDEGRCLFSGTVDEIQSTFTTLRVNKEELGRLEGLKEPLWRYDSVESKVAVYESLSKEKIPEGVEVIRTSLSDVFVAKVDRHRSMQ